MNAALQEVMKNWVSPAGWGLVATAMMIEPPGAFGLNSGRNTPLVTVLSQTVDGLVLALGYE